MSKDKWVRRFSVDETSRHKNGFTIYKITSVLFPMSSPEALSVVSVWKRYSEVRRLHAAARALHAGLRLRGAPPSPPRASYFQRYHATVIKERAKFIKSLMEFIAEHSLLFTSTDFVNFLQSGYPEPIPESAGSIATIRSELQLPPDAVPPLEYSQDTEPSPTHSARSPHSTDETDFSSIPVFEASHIDRLPTPQVSRADSFESLNSLGSISSDLYSELDKVSITKHNPLVKKNVLPDLINFDEPSTSRYDDDYSKHDTDSLSLSSANISNVKSEYSGSTSRMSSKSMLSLSNLSSLESKTKTEDSYVFEAGYMLNLAARYEEMKEYGRAFECYKAGIEKMLIGVQSDSDPQRRALIKEKTNKYLTYAETIYKNHLCDAEQSLLPEREIESRLLHCPVPLCMLKRPYAELAMYRVLAVLANHIMLVLHRGEQTCYAMKVMQKVPNNLTEFDEYFLQNTNETRQPILPTAIPYMVQLHSYIETNHLIFLILTYAPGEKLIDYIKNYAKSLPNTPAREVNLENVFSEPKVYKIDFENENNSIIKVETALNSEVSIIDRIEENTNNNNIDTKNTKTENYDSMDVSEIVLNSQKLLKNVDEALKEIPKDTTDNVEVVIGDVKIEIQEKEEERRKEEKVERRVETPSHNRLACACACVGALPAGAVRAWAAQLLAALGGLHNAGVVCRDLNPSNILLGPKGQIILTYFTSYPGVEMALSKIRSMRGDMMLYIAPELYEAMNEEGGYVCDFWSYGAVLYLLLTGLPLWYYHRSPFTSHTLLQLPDGLPIEVQSLLTQLLTYSPIERLGGGPDGIEEIKRHPYFKHIDWQQVYNDWQAPG